MEDLEKLNRSIMRLKWIDIFLLILIIGIFILIILSISLNRCGGSALPNIDYHVEIFNGKFTGYIGTQKGTTVKALLTSVKSVNSTDHSIKINNKDISEFEFENINDNSLYMINGQYSEDGYINNISIKKLED